MQTLGSFFYISLISIFYISPFSIALIKYPVPVTRRGLTSLKQTNLNREPDPLLDSIKIEVDPNLKFENPRLKKAYVALQEWKKAMISDPYQMTKNWVGPDVCLYTGVVCAQAPDDENIATVAVIDLNFGDIAGYLVPHLGLLTDLAILHLHSNRFFGIFPPTLSNLKLLFELDVSNNHFSGLFPSPVLAMSSLKFLDIRYNEFEGQLPPQIFDMDIDAFILNNNRFYNHLPKNIGNSPATVLVLSNNKFSGCIPRNLGQMPYLEQVSFANNRLTGCLPEEIGMLKYLTVFDVRKNNISGPIPKSFENLKTIGKIDLSCNQFSGKVDDSLCTLPRIWNITITDNYFNEIGAECDKLIKDHKLVLLDKDNCLANKLDQRPEKNCSLALKNPVNCKTIGCQARDHVDLKNRKFPGPTPKVQNPSPKTTPTPPSVRDPPHTPKPPPLQQPTMTTAFNDLILPPKTGS
ncbi:pollen-specific leucine-rich repeat extensin-like protein 1 [Tanacetum coccineum]|uniref:Pollen-specific leucine-rich repeat extensin-like protein 1 n=1 Tax=Tanacetum coccineum TaxID=301880 RepID=A0ABQ5BDW9_9ASTR